MYSFPFIYTHFRGCLGAAQVGYEAKQAFYVNDLGAQIGLTALAYSRCYHRMKPNMKVDHWIGTMYAVMNTFSELQKVGVNIGELGDACSQGQCAPLSRFWAELPVSLLRFLPVTVIG